MELLGFILVLVIIGATLELSSLSKQNRKLRNELIRTQASEKSLKEALSINRTEKVRVENMSNELKRNVTLHKNKCIALQELCNNLKGTISKYENKRKSGELYSSVEEYFVNTAKRPLSTGFLRVKFKTSHSAIDHVLKKLIENGVIRKKRHGEYIKIENDKE